MGVKITVITQKGNIEACFTRKATIKEIISFVIRHRDYPKNGNYKLDLLSKAEDIKELKHEESVQDAHIKDGDNLIFSAL